MKLSYSSLDIFSISGMKQKIAEEIHGDKVKTCLSITSETESEEILLVIKITDESDVKNNLMFSLNDLQLAQIIDFLKSHL